MLIKLMKSTNPTEHTMNDIRLYIGLEVPKDSIRCGIAHAGRSEPEVYAKWEGAFYPVIYDCDIGGNLWRNLLMRAQKLKSLNQLFLWPTGFASGISPSAKIRPTGW